MNAIEIRDLRKSFRMGKRRVDAVAGVDLEVKKGEIFGFLGPNGAGKTTTVRILSTLMPADRGVAIVAGIDVAKNPDEVRRKIGYVGQKGGQIPIQLGGTIFFCRESSMECRKAM